MHHDIFDIMTFCVVVCLFVFCLFVCCAGGSTGVSGRTDWTGPSVHAAGVGVIVPGEAFSEALQQSSPGQPFFFLICSLWHVLLYNS